MGRTILIVDDESNMRWVLGRALEQAGYTVHGAANGDEAANLVTREPIDLALLDLKLKGEDGLAILRRLRERQPELVVIMLTAYGTVPTAVEAMQLGAADFLRKPFDVEEVTFKIGRALERRAMQQELTRLTAQQRSLPAFDALIGASVAWQRVLAQAQQAAMRDQSALLDGEVGSGRTTLARAMHRASSRSVMRQSNGLSTTIGRRMLPNFAASFYVRHSWRAIAQLRTGTCLRLSTARLICTISEPCSCHWKASILSKLSRTSFARRWNAHAATKARRRSS